MSHDTQSQPDLPPGINLEELSPRDREYVEKYRRLPNTKVIENQNKKKKTHFDSASHELEKLNNPNPPVPKSDTDE